MSLEMIRRFETMVQKDPQLRDALRGASGRDGVMNLAVDLGKGKGLAFTREELQEYYLKEVASTGTESKLLSTSPTSLDPQTCEHLRGLARELCLKWET